MKRLTVITLMLSTVVAAWAPGCDVTTSKEFTCTGGETVWTCNWAAGDGPYQKYSYCASSKAQAIANTMAYGMSQCDGATITVAPSSCGTDGATSGNNYRTFPTQLRFNTDGPGSCDPSPGDNDCQICAESMCCDQYAACAADANCTCLIACFFDGGTVAACTSADSCGSPSAASVSTAACLNAMCPSECGSASGTMPVSCSGSSSSSASSSGGPSCTPGSFGPGDTCFSDGDCASCVCEPQTMTCG